MKVSKPIIGVFVVNSLIEDLLRQYTSFRGYFRYLGFAKASSKANVTLYFFSTSGINFKQKTVKGTYFDRDKGIWKQSKFPLPNVIIDRRGKGEGRTYQNMINRIRKKFRKNGVLSVNPVSYFDKWQVYKKLKKFSDVKPYLPETQQYYSRTDLFDFLKNHNKIYLKANYGSRGQSVMRIIKLQRGGYLYSHYRNRMVVGKVSSKNDLIQVLHKFFKGQKFIMQEAIELIKVDGRLVDFRAELQRNGDGEIEIVGIASRIGHNKAPITIHSSAYSIDEFFERYHIFSEDKTERIIREMKQFLYKTYVALEKVYGKFGDLGIDIGIDKYGRIWFIEPNARSAKVSFYKAFDTDTLQRAFLNPLEYAKSIYYKKRDRSRD